MKQTDPQLKLRIPPRLMEQIRQASQAGRRTLSAEIIGRLENSFAVTSDLVATILNAPSQGNLEARLKAIEEKLEHQIPVEDVLTEVSQLEARFKAIEALIRK